MEAKQINQNYIPVRQSSSSNGPLVNLILAVLVALTWSFWPSLRAVSAALTLAGASSSIVAEGTDQLHLELQRDVQKHFLIYGVYIPLEDIMLTQHLTERNKDLESVLRQTCGSSRFALWLPLVVRIPLVGERSSEWCWNIALKK